VSKLFSTFAATVRGVDTIANAVLKVIHNIGVAVDYGASMLLWLHEEEPMTISTRCDLARDWPRQAGLMQDWLRALAVALNWIDRGALKQGSTHCRLARLADIQRAEATITRLTLKGKS
jgi:hypothetical protein